MPETENSQDKKPGKKPQKTPEQLLAESIQAYRNEQDQLRSACVARATEMLQLDSTNVKFKDMFERLWSEYESTAHRIETLQAYTILAHFSEAPESAESIARNERARAKEILQLRSPWVKIAGLLLVDADYAEMLTSGLYPVATGLSNHRGEYGRFQKLLEEPYDFDKRQKELTQLLIPPINFDNLRLRPSHSTPAFSYSVLKTIFYIESRMTNNSNITDTSAQSRQMQTRQELVHLFDTA